jgi:hypothetical protein
MKNNLAESKKQIVITESQYKRLFEQKISKKDIFQDLIDDKLQNIKNACDTDSEDEYGYDTCEQVDIIESIKVDNVIMTSTILIELTINYISIANSFDFDEVIYAIQYGLKKSTGLSIVLNYKTSNIKTFSE